MLKSKSYWYQKPTKLWIENRCNLGERGYAYICICGWGMTYRKRHDLPPFMLRVLNAIFSVICFCSFNNIFNCMGM